MCLYLSGDVEPAKVRESIERVFGAEKSLRSVPAHGDEPCLWPIRGTWIDHKFEKGAEGKKVHCLQHEQVRL